MKIRGLNPVYNGPYIVLDRTEKYFKKVLNTRVNNVSIDRLKAGHTDEEILQANTSSTFFEHSLSPGPQQSDESRDATPEQRRQSRIPVLVPRPQKRISIVNEPYIVIRQSRKIRKPAR